ncbi:MAG: hypothetical protein CVU95_06565 [Firmicutes bacterium HGW-Firmicutes-2]|nr:MAG: hypothetical protein CVU95_06565 [Firmicutes bacterium HGW-Firmicutes-2]
MMMIMVAVCDDQKSDRQNMKDLLNDYCILKNYDIKIIPFESGEALEKYYIMNDFSFDIIFLDIYMGGMNGIVTAKKIRKLDLESKIIFTTSSPDHALESFEVFPFHYLIKPINKSDFHTTFERAINMIDKEKQKSLLVKIGSCLQTIFFKDILFIESNARILTIYTVTDKSYSFSAKLDDLQKQLQDSRFNRCHKSYLVNMDYISSLEGHSFKLINNTQIPITQRNYVTIKKIFYDYLVVISNINNHNEKGED